MPTSLRLTATNKQDKSKSLDKSFSLNLKDKEVDKHAKALQAELSQEGYTIAPYLQVIRSRFL